MIQSSNFCILYLQTAGKQSNTPVRIIIRNILQTGWIYLKGGKLGGGGGGKQTILLSKS